MVTFRNYPREKLVQGVIDISNNNNKYINSNNNKGMVYL